MKIQYELSPQLEEASGENQEESQESETPDSEEENNRGERRKEVDTGELPRKQRKKIRKSMKAGGKEVKLKIKHLTNGVRRGYN